MGRRPSMLKAIDTKWQSIIICAIDYLNKWAKLGALSGCTAEQIAVWVEDNILRRVPYPDEIITNQGVKFSGDFHSMLRAYSVWHRRTQKRHPQSNGLVERLNRTMKACLEALEREQEQLAT